MSVIPKSSFGKAALIVFFVALTGFVVFNRSGSEKEETPEKTPEPEEEVRSFTSEIIGRSVEGRAIEAHTLEAGQESEHLVFVGGIHGGYEWNSVLLAYEALDYLKANPDVVPDNVTVTIIPSANPDGVHAVVGTTGRFPADAPVEEPTQGRFNANGVDLNRNFDCKWQPESTWRGQTVSAGTEPFSEPEARAIRDFVTANDPSAVIFWHSQSNAVYASECEDGILPETLTLMQTYADAGGYPSVETFDHYEITGDAEGWLASIGIPAVTVELSTHETIEWDQNRAAMKALFEMYGG